MSSGASIGGRFLSGFSWGVAATLVMSAIMLAGVATGLSPMPKPVPAAILGKLGAGNWPATVMMAAAGLAHLGYGGLWGGLLAAGTRPVTVWKGLALGIGLWSLMQIVVLPFLGWGAFGSAVTPKIAIATLLLHLIYGGTVGVFTDST